MRILIFNWRDLKHSWAGGGEIYVFELAKRWVKMGHRITVFCGQDQEKNLPEKETYRGINIIRKGGRYSLYFWAFWLYITQFRKNSDFIVDVENGIPFFTPLFCRLPKVAFVYHVHGQQFFYELSFPISHIGFFVEKYLFPIFYRSTPVIAISKTTKKELENLGFPKKNITVVYCGINNFSKRNKLVKQKFLTPTLLYLGRIKSYKRVDLLIDIFPELLRKNPKLRLIIAGWGTETAYITNLVMKSPHRRRIELMGPVSNQEKRRLLTKSWIFVNLSIGEGWSIAVIESNLHGTPAIAFKVPGLSESIKHGKTGFLAKNREDLIYLLNELINNHKIRNDFSENALEWAHSFSWDTAAKESLSIIKKVIRK